MPIRYPSNFSRSLNRRFQYLIHRDHIGVMCRSVKLVSGVEEVGLLRLLQVVHCPRVMRM